MSAPSKARIVGKAGSITSIFFSAFREKDDAVPSVIPLRHRSNREPRAGSRSAMEIAKKRTHSKKNTVQKRIGMAERSHTSFFFRVNTMSEVVLPVPPNRILEVI